MHLRVAYNSSNRLCSPARYSRLLHHDLVASCHCGNSTRGSLDEAQVRSGAFSNTCGLGRGVDAHEDQVGFGDGFVDVCREEEVFLAISCSSYNIMKPWLEDRQML